MIIKQPYSMIKFALTLLSFACITCVFAQKDSSFIIMRNGQAGVFPFKVYQSSNQVKAQLPTSYPAYVFEPKQVKRLNELILYFVENEKDYNQQLKLYSKKDSLLLSKIDFLQKNDSLEKLKTLNYESSYNKLLELNKKYDADLIKCEKLALDTNNKKIKNTLIVGTAAACGGFLLGILFR